MANGMTAVQAGDLELRHVTKVFDAEKNPLTVVENCSFRVERGKLTVMVGPSGCGKTTLINLIAGYEAPTAGEIRLDGAPVQGPGSDRLVVFQETALFPWMTVLENVVFGPVARGTMNRKEAERQARLLLEKVGLTDFAHRYPKQLSGGMQRRAELARALINQPRVMLMDEPFRGLDHMTRQLMQEYLLRLFEENGGTVLFLTHEVEEAIFLADRVLIMGSRPTSVRKVMDIDLPRPRDFSILTSRRYQELWTEAMETLYEEAAKAFAGGAALMGDMVEAMGVRRHPH